MNRIHEGMVYKDFEQPISVEAVSVCASTGLLARMGCSTTTEYFETGTAPTDYCYYHFYTIDTPSPEVSLPEDTTQEERPEEVVPEITIIPNENDTYIEDTNDNYNENIYDENYNEDIYVEDNGGDWDTSGGDGYSDDIWTEVY